MSEDSPKGQTQALEAVSRTLFPGALSAEARISWLQNMAQKKSPFRDVPRVSEGAIGRTGYQ